MPVYFGFIGIGLLYFLAFLLPVAVAGLLIAALIGGAVALAEHFERKKVNE